MSGRSVLVRGDNRPGGVTVDKRLGRCPRCWQPVLVCSARGRNELLDERIGRDGQRTLWRHTCPQPDAEGAAVMEGCLP
jgi:hypothetical protein